MVHFFGIACAGVLVPLAALVLYQLVLAGAAILQKRPPHQTDPAKSLRFLILIPAHNEEYSLRATLQRIAKIQHPTDSTEVVVIADRCTDTTVSVAKQMGVTCLERSSGLPGKGPAIAWALEEVKARGVIFDALVILDADTLADPFCLEAFQAAQVAGHQVQQGYCYISNPWQSSFTRVIAVSSIVRNWLFYGGKSSLGLAGMLAGTGMCFSASIIKRYGWTAFSVGEDWEFSASLLLAGEKIYFNPWARVYQLESSSIRQASGQRLRWAGGRHAVISQSAKDILVQGIRNRSFYLMDAALTVVAPNLSSQASLALLCTGWAWVLVDTPYWSWLFSLSVATTVGLAFYFFLGVLHTESPVRTLLGIPLIPIFLPWRLTIEILGLFGYGRKRWIPTSRLSASNRETDHFS